MKNKSLATWLGSGALALSLAVLPSTLPASAQTATDPVVPGNRTTTTETSRNDGFDWGWLGLLGLIGLAGLKGNDRDKNTNYSDRTTTAPSTSTNPRY